MRLPIQTSYLESKPQFAVVTANPKWGYGIFSLHHIAYEAKHNARLTNGRAVPLDWVGEEPILPPLARTVMDFKS